MGWLLIAFILYFLFDLNYFIRSWLSISFYLIKSCFLMKELYEDSVQYGICLTTDLDNMCHMNNARYLRECDFGRSQFFIERRFPRALKQLKGKVLNAGNNMRYRRSLHFLDIFKLKTKVIYWDDKAFYLEQQLVRNSDDFICAINICKMCVLGCTTQNLVDNLYGHIQPPEPSVELQRLLESWQLSSERLRKSS